MTLFSACWKTETSKPQLKNETPCEVHAGCEYPDLPSQKETTSVAERIDSLDEADELCMSFVTYAELLKGAQRSTRKDEALRRIEGLCFLIAVLYPTGPAICLRYAEQSARLRAAGNPIGGNDLWIAAHALADDAMLVTNNVGEFSRIEGLRVENWVA